MLFEQNILLDEVSSLSDDDSSKDRSSTEIVLSNKTTWVDSTSSSSSSKVSLEVYDESSKVFEFIVLYIFI